MNLIDTLAGGALDIIGDVHGELDALNALIEKLGYRKDGSHPHGRTLMFVGDLCDRGPDSPGVIRQVQEWVRRDRAQAILGNHELNLLRHEKKHGNGWFYGKSYDPEFGSYVAISPPEQEPILEFFRSLPLALEREDLRVVHAAWIDDAADACRRIDGPADRAYQIFQKRLEADPAFQKLKHAHDADQERLGEAIKHAPAAPTSHAIGPYDEKCQMGNPVRVLTSGVEKVTSEPFKAAGRWRYVTRVPWWKAYDSSIPVIFGHYWRWWNPAIHSTLSKGEPHLFAEDSVGAVMMAHDRAFCIDFSVGARYKQRLRGDRPPFHGRLAALRWPERQLVFDNDDPSRR